MFQVEFSPEAVRVALGVLLGVSFLVLLPAFLFRSYLRGLFDDGQPPGAEDLLLCHCGRLMTPDHALCPFCGQWMHRAVHHAPERLGGAEGKARQHTAHEMPALRPLVHHGEDR